MTKKKYFKKEYDEEYYIFDSTTISEEKVNIESEYGYEVFSNAMMGDEVVDLLNEQDTEIKQLKLQNKRQYKLIKRWKDLMFARDWEALEKIVTTMEKVEEALEND